jgi:uncharacterized membrane protein
MAYLFHFHLFAAIAWIGGSIFMFILGISLRDKQKQREVYPHIGPIFGYFELISLIILVISGTFMIQENGLLDMLLASDDSHLTQMLFNKLVVVALMVIATVVHFVIAYKTNNTQRTKLQNII